jgi:hypothetical protein
VFKKDDDEEVVASGVKFVEASDQDFDIPDMELTISVKTEDLATIREEMAACQSAEEVAMLLADLARRYKVVSSKGVSKEVN